MKKRVTELVFILDRSGSMSGLEGDTIGGYNAMLQKQKKGPGEAVMTTVLFDDNYELLHDRVDLRSVESLTEKEYFVRGTTALLDAVGKTIVAISNAQKLAAERERSDHVLFVITTDGMENASREFTYEKVRNMIETHKKEFGWEFLFLGANIDAITTANLFGIEEDRAVNFHADSDGTQLNYEVISETISSLREHSKIESNWKERIEADYLMRE